MKDTIELLETIGKDASLRYMSNQDLADKLDTLEADESLKAAAATGDSRHLSQALDCRWLNSLNNPSNTNVTVPDVPDEEEEEGDDEVEREQR